MKVLLLEHVENLGNAGDVVDVSEGHARNFLFPKGLAAAATEGRVQEVERKQAQEHQEAKATLEAITQEVDSLDGMTIPVEVQVGPEEKPFGAVTARIIAEAVKNMSGVDVPKGGIQLDEPIKELGEHRVRIEFPHGLEAEVIVEVRQEKE